MEQYKDLEPTEKDFEKVEETRIMSELAKIDGLHEYLRAVMARDMRLHFTSPKEQQDLIRGAFFRTEYFSKRISKTNNK